MPRSPIVHESKKQQPAVSKGEKEGRKGSNVALKSPQAGGRGAAAAPVESATPQKCQSGSQAIASSRRVGVDQLQLSPLNTKRVGPSGREESEDALAVPLSRPRPYAVETDFIDAFYTPHTLMAIVVVLSSLAYLLKWYYNPSMSTQSNVKLGLLACAWVFAVFGMIHFPDSLLVRPHPIAWRAVLAVLIMYLMLLTFLFFQDLATVRAIIGYYDPSTLVRLPDREYANDCRMSTEQEPFLFAKTAFDIFILAHSLGYFMKTLIIRDWRIVTCVSIGFEVLEVTFQHILPNFRECWWDHVILDVLICNAGGTILGMVALHLLKAKRYRWVKLTSIKSYRGKAQRVLRQLGPRTFETYEWDVFRSPKRLAQVMGLLALLFLQEMNCFTMKHILQWPAEHHLVLARLTLWSLVAMPTLREFYDYISNPKVDRLGSTAWVALLTMLLETIFIGKLSYEGGFFTEAFPCYISIPWIGALVLFTAWVVLYFLLPIRWRSVCLVKVVLNTLFYGSLVVLALMFMMGLPDIQWKRREFVGLMQHLQVPQCFNGVA